MKTSLPCQHFENFQLSRDQAVALYRTMCLIRRTELVIEEEYPSDEMKTPIHLSLGQEAVAAGVCIGLLNDDMIFSNHRSHAHYLAKGGDLNAMMAELYGRSTGCARGRGGSMHLIDTRVGHFGSSAIVAGGVPHAAGAALAMKLQGKRTVAVAFLGDGACQQGVFYESLSWAALKKVPVIFVIENNFYSVCSPLSVREPNEAFAERAGVFGIPSCRVDGMNVIDVFASAREAIDQARDGRGPFLLEYRVQRWRGHAGSGDPNAAQYRSAEELAEGYRRDPVEEFKAGIGGIVDAEVLREIEAAVEERVRQAVAFAKESPVADGSDVGRHVFCD